MYDLDRSELEVSDFSSNSVFDPWAVSVVVLRYIGGGVHRGGEVKYKLARDRDSKESPTKGVRKGQRIDVGPSTKTCDFLRNYRQRESGL